MVEGRSALEYELHKFLFVGMFLVLGYECFGVRLVIEGVIGQLFGRSDGELDVLERRLL